MADNLPQLAWMAHGDGWVFWFNQRWFDYTGSTLEDMEGWGWRRVHHPDYVEGVIAKMRNSIEQGVVWEDTSLLRSEDGTYRWFLSRAVPIRDESGRVVRWFGTSTDVTEQMQVEERLQEADRQKDEFLAMLGHELRNPLAAIRTASELMKVSSDANPTLAKTQAVLERQTTHMAKLLDGLLDLSRIIRGKIRLHLESVDLVAVCQQVVDDAANRDINRNVELRTEMPTGPMHVKADRVRLAQIVDNLLSNAVKFTPDGESVGKPPRRCSSEKRITDDVPQQKAAPQASLEASTTSKK
jgi:PAS domain S-box-containing protein